MQIGFFSMLTLIFVTLKLTDYVDWSWWLVLLPAYGVFLLFMILFLIIFIMDEKSKVAGKKQNDIENRKT
jgi:hypothetical protein